LDRNTPHQSLVKPAQFALKIQFSSPFSVPTFPEPAMFEMPRLDVATLEQWYRWFREQILQFRNTGTRFYDQNNVVPFPSTIPFEQVIDFQGAVANLYHLHREMCSNIRIAAFQQKGNHPKSHDNSKTVDLAIGQLDEILRSLRKNISKDHYKTRRLEEYEPTEHFAEMHRQWVRQFKEYLDQLLSRPTFNWKASRFAGDFVGCQLGHEIYQKDGLLWLNRAMPEVQRMVRLHKDFHGMMMVEAEVASSLRVRGLSYVEQKNVRTLVQNRVNSVLRLSESLIESIDPAFHAASGSPTKAPSANMERLKPIPLVEILKAMESWESRVIRFIKNRSDNSIESTLLHTGCPTGTRIAHAILDPVLAATQKSSLALLDNAHINYHTTAATLVAFVQEGLIEEAELMITKLQRDGTNLAASLQSLSHALNLTK